MTQLSQMHEPQIHKHGPILLTGITGLIGARVAARLLAGDRRLRIHALIRRPEAWPAVTARLGAAAARVVPVVGDIRRPGLGLEPAARERLARQTRSVVHCAGDVTFSRPLDQARETNSVGTGNVLELIEGRQVTRFVHVSSAYAAGRRTGRIPEAALDGEAGFVNGYEQSKHEAELLVRAAGVPFVILRPSALVCDDRTGAVTQFNSVHRALRVCHAGLAALLPAKAETPLDTVTTDHVARGVVELGFTRGTPGRTYHLCAGRRAMSLGELFDRCHAFWRRDRRWRGRGIMRPAFTDIDTYRVFEASVEETGDVRLTAILRSLSHFVPQLALPKQFDTDAADAALGYAAPAPAEYWEAMLKTLTDTHWGATTRRAA